MNASASIEWQLVQLRKLDQAGLRKQYALLYGKAAPIRVPVLQLRQAVANRLHQRLLARMRSKLQQVLNAGEAIVSILVASSRQTELFCEWRGRVHSVQVVEDGVLYRGKHFDSLSAVARVITRRKDAPDLFRIGLSSTPARSGS